MGLDLLAGVVIVLFVERLGIPSLRVAGKKRQSQRQLIITQKQVGETLLPTHIPPTLRAPLPPPLLVPLLPDLPVLPQPPQRDPQQFSSLFLGRHGILHDRGRGRVGDEFVRRTT